MAACSEDFICGDDFDDVLAISRFYHYGTNASEAVEKTAIDEKDYQKRSLCVTVCIATNMFTTKIFRIILNGKTLLYSGLS